MGWLANRLGSNDTTQRSFESLFKRGLDHLRVDVGPTAPYEQVDAVYIAVNAIATSLASIPYAMMQGDTEQEDHDLIKLFEQPNQVVIGSQIFEATVIHLELSGRAFWLLDGLRSTPQQPTTAIPTRIIMLDPTKMKAVLDGVGELKHWVFTQANGTPKIFSKEEIVRFAYYHPNPKPDEPFAGLAPLMAARLGYHLAWKSTKFQELFYTHGGFPPFYLFTPEKATIGKDERKTLRNEFNRLYMGLRNAWKMPILGRGAELKSIAVNQKDAEWMNTTKLTRENILAIFGTPPAVVGFMETANRANSQEQKRFFWTRTIPPKTTMIRHVIQATMVDRFWPGMSYKWKSKERLAEAIPEDVRAAIEAADKLISRGVPPATAYEFLGLELDTKGQEALQIGWLPFNVVPAESLLIDEEEEEDDDEAAETENEDEDDDAIPEDDTEEEDDGNTGHEDEDEKSFFNSARAIEWRKHAAGLDTQERLYLGKHRKFLKWYETKVLAGIKALELFALVTPKAFPSQAAIKAQLKATTGVASAGTVEFGWTTLLSEIGGGAPFEAANPAVVSILKARAISSQGAVGKLQAKIAKNLAAGVKKGETAAQLTARVQKVVGTHRQGMARTIARTETSSAYSESRFASMDDNGITQHEWLTARDGDVRASHIAEDGSVVDIGDPFPVTGLLHPLAGGPAEEVVNCRCVATPKIKEDE